MKGILTTIFGSLALLMASGMACAQNYPARPVKIVVPFAPGAGTDIAMRLLQPKWNDLLGQPFVLDFKPAAGGVVGTESVARAPADGYTLLAISGSHTSAPFLIRNLPYDPVKDFTAVSPINRSDQTLIVNPKVPANTVQELIALAKARPGKLNYASNGGSLFLIGERFKIAAGGINIVHVPYKASAQAMTDVISGVSDMMFQTATLTIALANAGKLRILGVANSKRSPWLPNTPTLAEAGLGEFEAISIVGLLAPAGTPAPIVNRLNGTLEKILLSPEIKESFNSTNTEVWWSTAEQFGAWIRNDVAKWAAVTKAINFQPE